MCEVAEWLPRVVSHVIPLPLNQIIRLGGTTPLNHRLLEEGLDLVLQFIIKKDGRWRGGPEQSALGCNDEAGIHEIQGAIAEAQVEDQDGTLQD